MTNNMDEFDQDQFEAEEQEKSSRGVKQSFAEAWRNKPLFKLLVIMGVVGFALAGALGVFSGSPAIEAARIAAPSNLNEPPGPKASPFFNEQAQQANQQRVKEAMETSGSAMPTPMGNNVDLSELTDKNKKDPLLEFRAETERLRQEMRAEQKLSAQQLQLLQQQMAQRNQQAQEDDSLARAMQKQMQELMEGWRPRKLTSVAGIAPEKPAEKTTSATLVSGTALDNANAAAAQPLRNLKTLVAAGTVSYAQLLTEANSDVQGPILAQILSGPLAGARAIGRFQVMNDYLVMTFTLVSYKGKDYSINGLALDPDTTLGGMATEVDHRYFTRILLPAAGAFMSAYGSTMASGSSETTVNGDTVIVTQAKKGYKDATYAGLGQVGETIGQFFQNEANQTKPLVRVAAGTPMGLFFLQPVFDETLEQQRAAGVGQSDLAALLAQGYRQGANNLQGTSATDLSSYYNPTAATNPYATGVVTNPYATNPYATSTVTNPYATGTTTVLNPSQLRTGTPIYLGR